MKKWLLNVIEWYSLKGRSWKWLPLMFIAFGVNASPYLYTPFTKGGQVYLSQGALFSAGSFAYNQTFTNVALAYHPLSSGSIIPVEYQRYLPPEAWSINFGGGYASKTGATAAGPGISINLLDSVRAYASTLLSASSNQKFKALGTQIAPGNGPLTITLGPQWATNVVQNGIVLPLNQWRLKPYWFIGCSYGF